MVAQLTTVHYPESDGKPMADNTKQFHWITVIKQNLDQGLRILKTSRNEVR